MRMRAVVTACLVVALVVGLGAANGVLARTSDTVTIAQGADISNGDPHRTGLTTDFNVLANIYETLVSRDPDLHIQPGLAVSWKVVGPTTWEFKLRQGVRFHDGEPFNARAVKFSIERGKDPRFRWARAFMLAPIRSVTVIDDDTVRFETTGPIPSALFLQLLAVSSFIVPPGYLGKNGDEALIRQPVGTGPYRFVRWVRDDHVELEANPTYWGGRPHIGHVIVRDIPNDATRLSELLAGSVDIINLIPPTLFSPIQSSSRTKLVQGASLSIFFIHFNLINISKDRPLADPRVRLALNYAVARRQLITTIMHGIGTPVATFCVALQFGCDTSIPVTSYDVSRAKTLLAQAGYSNGFDMTIATTSGSYPGDRDLTLAVSDQLNLIGVRAHPVIVEYGILQTQRVNRKVTWDAIFTRATSFYANAGELGFSNFSSNAEASLWSPADPEFEQLLTEAQQSSNDTQAKAFLRKAQLLFRDESPSIPLLTSPNVYGMSHDLQWTPRPDLLLTMASASWQ